jgi:tRNA G10  N-methylase Trm11
MKKTKIDFDFLYSDTLNLTHGFHTYPAKMIPQVANTLINEFGKNANLLFDPYCGTGTTLVEASLKGVNSIGVDLNPLARLISKVKTTSIEIQTLQLHLKDFYRYLFEYRFGFKMDDNVVTPVFPRIDFWFSKSVKNKLGVINEYIKKIENSDIADFFKLAFSQTIRDCSYTRNNEFKLYKMSKEKIKTFNPDVYSTIENILGRNFRGLEKFIKEKKNNSICTIYDFNTINYIPKKILKNNSVDIVVTSPPYGDSSTTVAYGQFSALSNQWLGWMDNGRKLDNDLMGGRTAKKRIKFKSEILNSDIDNVYNEDEKRALDVVSFYRDYDKSIKMISKIVKPKGFVCYVVSNRTVRNNVMHTDEITKDFFSSCGFNHVDTLYRKISNKRLPRQNSPKGIAGQKTELMNKESIIIMQKN